MVNTFEDKPATLPLGSGVLSPALESALMGLSEGDRRQFEFEEGVAFGPHNPDMVQRVTRKMLDELQADPDAQYEPGSVVQFPTPDGFNTFSGVVRQVQADWLEFDFNHPLAGQAVSFEVQIIGVL